MRCFYVQNLQNLVIWFLLLLITKGYADNHLDSTIFESIIPSSSEKCKEYDSNWGSNGSLHKNTFSYPKNLTRTDWNHEAHGFESELFLAEMSHINFNNSNHSWRIRIGQGGNIYSFRGPFGEAIPPQYHIDGEYVDEVMQTVTVDQIKNRLSGQNYFIHQAGTYRRDDRYTNEKPFFSPSVAKYCFRNHCSFASWGQQASIPTFHQSDILYFNRYRDCGDGVLEFTSVIHNAAADLENGDDLTYLNVPWGGVRRSILRDFFVSNPNGKLELQFPQKYFFQSEGVLEKDTGGFATFAEKVIIPDQTYNRKRYELPEEIRLVVVANPASKPSPGHSARFNLHCSSANIRATTEVKSGCKDCDLWLRNVRTGVLFHMQMVLHWSWNGNMLYFCSKEQHNFNDVFFAGDEIVVSHANIGKTDEENLALTFVHGFTSATPQRWAASRIRFGTSGELKRDYNVYTNNRRISVKPGDTYVSRQYILTGSLTEMETSAKSWVKEAKDDLYPLGEMPSVDIHLFSNSSNISSFGAYVAGSDINCLQGQIICSGKASPHYGMTPHFIIHCGDRTYVGPDRYHFSPPRYEESDPFRPYVCDGEIEGIRPEWKLLGFFKDSSCDLLKESKFEENACHERGAHKNRAPRL